MRVICDPPIERWELERRDDGRGGAGSCSATKGDRVGLVEAVNRMGGRVGAGRLRVGRPIVATGHQAWLWHPGILAKDIASCLGAERHGAQALHVVVDQDVYDSLRLEVPVVRGDRLRVERVAIGGAMGGVPAGCLPPVDPVLVRETLVGVGRRLGDALAVDLDPLIEAFSGGPHVTTLAEQLVVVLSRLKGRYVGSMPVLFAGRMGLLKVFGAVVGQILADASRCVGAYNRAVRAHPSAGVAAMSIERDRVEVPLWWLRWGRARERVYVDLSDTVPEFQLGSGEPVSTAGVEHERFVAGVGCLAPRALLMTAVLRRYCCDLFVHGKGGGAYDRITEQWWVDWRGEKLAPLAVVSADLTLDFDVPVSGADELTRAVWWAHHLPHNVDRAIEGGRGGGLDPADVSRKREVLGTMVADRDPRRRAELFGELHRINRRFQEAEPGLMSEAGARLERARVGLANKAVADKRDWCFAFYDHKRIEELSVRLMPSG